MRIICLAVLLVCALHWHSASAQFYGNREPQFGQLPELESQHQQLQQPPVLSYACPAGDACCPFNDSPADCLSTASKNKGCRSDSSCAPAEDPCKTAANETGCLAVGHFCTFDINTFTCKLDPAHHPCAGVAEASTCSNTAGCRVQHVCRNTCAICPTCLDAMRAFAKMPSVLAQLEKDDSNSEGESGFQTSAFLKGYCHAAASNILPSTQTDLMAGCSRIAEDIVRSPALLARPAALCKRLGLCQANCQLQDVSSAQKGENDSSGTDPSLAPSGGSSKKEGIDFCSPTGLVSGAVPEKQQIDKATAREGSMCLSSEDCLAGMDCDAFSNSVCLTKCDPETGMDTCTSAGQCVDICQRPDIKAIVEESQRRFRPCTSAAGCNTGEECKLPTFPCTMVQCNPQAISRGLDFVEAVICPKICLPQAPRMLNATFSDDGSTIQVVLNQEAAPMNALCSFVFDEATSQLLGSASTCTTEGNLLKVWLAGDVQIRPNSQPLTLGDTNALFTSAFGAASPGGPLTFSGSLPRVLPCSDCSASAVELELVGPSEIAMVCNNEAAGGGGATGDFRLFHNFHDEFARLFNPGAIWGSQRSEGFNYVAQLPPQALWMVKDLQWNVEAAAAAAVTAMQQLVDATNNKTHNWDRQQLSIPISLLKSMPEGPIRLSVKLTNIFNITSSSDITFHKSNSTEAPLFELDKSFNRFFPSAGFRLAAMQLPSACPLTKVNWKWSTSIPGVDLSDATGPAVAFPAQELMGNVEVGKTYTVTLVASYEDSSGSTSDTLTLTALGSPLSINLSGPSGVVPLDASNLTYDARGSFDPDDPYNTAGQMSFLWTCTNTAELTPCFGKQIGGVWSLEPSQLKEGAKYVVSVTIAKGDRSATSSRAIIPRSGQPPSVQLARSCGVDVASGAVLPCPSLHNPTEPLTLVAIPDPPLSLEDMMLSWWYDPITVPSLVLNENNTVGGTSLPSLTILPEALPNGGAITINVNLSNWNNPLKSLFGGGNFQFKAGAAAADNAEPSPASSPPTNEPQQQPQQQQQQQKAAPPSGMSSLTIPLNGPPFCSTPDNSCLTLDKTVANYPDAKFRACAVAWADPEKDPLTYEFGIVSNGAAAVAADGSSAEQQQQQEMPLQTHSGSNCFTFCGLPTGPATLYVCALDSLGARTCQQADVAVLEPSSDLEVADIDSQLKKLNEELDSPAAAANPPSLVDAAMQMTSLFTVTTKSVADSVVGLVEDTVKGVHTIMDDIKKAFVPSSSSRSDTADDTDDSSTSSNGLTKIALLVASPHSSSSKASGSSHGSSGSSKLLLPAATSDAARNTTTKLLRMMADASSPRDPDATLGLLTAGEALSSRAPMTPEGGVALLDLFRTAMTASSSSQRPLTPQLSTAFANALTRGLDAATLPAAGSDGSAAAQPPAAGKESGAAAAGPHPISILRDGPARSLLLESESDSQEKSEDVGAAEWQLLRRRLLIVSTNATRGGMVLLSADQAYQIIKDGAFRLSYAQKVTLGSVPRTAGNAGVCVGPALLTKGGVDGFNIAFDCPGVTLPAQATLPSSFSEACAASSDCVSADNILVWSNYFSPDSRSVPVIMAVVDQPDNLLADDPNVATEVISGVMNVTLSFSGPGGAFCAGNTFADVTARGNGCKAELELPLSGDFNLSKTAACVQLIPDPNAPGRLKAGAVEPVTSIRDLDVTTDKDFAATSAGFSDLGSSQNPKKAVLASATRSKRAVARCGVSRQGLWVVAQFDPAASAREDDPLSSDLMAALGATLGSYELIPGEFTDEEVQVDKKGAASFTFNFALDADAIMNNPVELTRFKTELQRAFLAGLAEQWSDGPELSDALGALRLAYVSVGPMRAAGGIVADVTLMPPIGTTPAQLAQLSQLSPAELISTNSSLRGSLLSGERVTSYAAGGSRFAPRQLGGDIIIGIVVGCVGLMAAVLAMVVVTIRRRAGTVDLDDASEHSSERQHLSAAGTHDARDGSGAGSSRHGNSAQLQPAHTDEYHDTAEHGSSAASSSAGGASAAATSPRGNSTSAKPDVRKSASLSDAQ